MLKNVVSRKDKFFERRKSVKCETAMIFEVSKLEGQITCFRNLAFAGFVMSGFLWGFVLTVFPRNFPFFIDLGKSLLNFSF